MKACGMSTVTKSRSSIASIVDDKMIDLIATVRADTSSLIFVSRCFLPSAHMHALTLLHRLFDMNIGYSSEVSFSELATTIHGFVHFPFMQLFHFFQE
jgi:hypothetical protein